MREALLVCCLLAACIPDQAATLFDGTYPGQSSYTATITGEAQGEAGAAPLTVVDDNDVEMHLGSGCTLAFGAVILDSDSRGQGTSATATLAGDDCEVPVDGGTAILDVTSGNATSTGGTSLSVSIGGTLGSFRDTPSTGYITFTFNGAWTHN